MNSCQAILETIKGQYMLTLGNNLVGIYVHGSIAFRCFRWEKSDIDFIVVVKDKIDTNTKLRLLETLEALLPQSPPKGIEISVVLLEYCEKFRYPTPYELHFSNDWLVRYRENPMLLCDCQEKSDRDLAAHFTVIRHTGIVLCGLPIDQVFGDVNKAYYIDSIKNDIADAKKEISEKPVYITLNLCRVLAYLKSGLILSKKQGGEWGLAHLAEQYHDLIKMALACYSGDAQMIVDGGVANRFCDEMLSEINRFPT